MQSRLVGAAAAGELVESCLEAVYGGAGGHGPLARMLDLRPTTGEQQQQHGLIDKVGSRPGRELGHGWAGRQAGRHETC